MSRQKLSNSTPITVWPIWGQILALVLSITELWVFLNFLPVHLPNHKWLTDKSQSVLWIPEKKGIDKFWDHGLDYISGLSNGRINLKRNIKKKKHGVHAVDNLISQKFDFANFFELHLIIVMLCVHFYCTCSPVLRFYNNLFKLPWGQNVRLKSSPNDTIHLKEITAIHHEKLKQMCTS